MARVIQRTQGPHRLTGVTGSNACLWASQETLGSLGAVLLAEHH